MFASLIFFAQGLHQKYDRNLIKDDDHDIEHHLEEKRLRLARMRRMTMRYEKGHITCMMYSCIGFMGKDG